jgi:arylsulfatase A-like enzyme
MKHYLTFLAALAFIFTGCQQQLETDQDNTTDDPRMAGFEGKIGRTFDESVEDWPEELVYTGKEPNVLLILLDDTGFAQLGSFGGAIETPSMDALAAGGLRYNNFHTTALCSPSRAAIMAGRNHHSIGLGSHALSAMGFPGYTGRVPLSSQEVARVVRDQGWTTYAIGKWDHTPGFQVHQVGPFTYWPTNDGFDHTYTFMSADANNFMPVMYAGHEPIEPSRGKPDYHLSEDMADKAIHYMTGQVSINPEKPFFMFWAPGAMHAPHHAPKAYIDHYKGKFDMGWDELRKQIYQRQLEMGIIPKGTVLTERPERVPAWESLNAKEKTLMARQMETFAGQLTHTDEQIGRMIATLKRTGKFDNTLIIITSDNGASAEGGLNGTHNEVLVINSTMKTDLEENYKKQDVWGSIETNNHYNIGWTMAGNTPFKYFKQTVHHGGTADPLVVSWPAGIKAKGEIRDQFAHIIDIGPTIMEALGVTPPPVIDGIKQSPFEGTSMLYTFNEADAQGRHTRQYFEQLGNRGMYLDGWVAVTLHADRLPFEPHRKGNFDDDVWELYNVAEDRSQSKDLAKEYPEKLEELKKAWDEEALKYNVYPLHDDFLGRVTNVNKRFAPQRKEFVFYPPGAVRISEQYSPPVKNRNHIITAYAEIPAGGASGVLVATGGIYSGYALYVKDNRIVYQYNAYNEDLYTITATKPLPTGKVIIEAKYMASEDKKSATVILSVNGKEVGRGEVGRTVPGTYSLTETFDVGQDTGTPVSKDYDRDNEFTGTLDKVVFNLN